MVWWSSLLYLGIVGRFELGPIVYVSMLAACSVQIGAFIQLLRALLQWVADTALDAVERR